MRTKLREKTKSERGEKKRPKFKKPKKEKLSWSE